MLVLLLAIRAWCSCCWCNTNSRYDPKIVRVSYGRRPDRNEMAPTWAPDLCRSMGTYWVRNGQTYPSVWFRNRAKAMLDDGRSQYLQHGNMLYLCLPLIFQRVGIPHVAPWSLHVDLCCEIEWESVYGVHSAHYYSKNVWCGNYVSSWLQNWLHCEFCAQPRLSFGLQMAESQPPIMIYCDD